VLVTLRVHLADGKNVLLAAEVDEAPETAAELLERFTRRGEIALSDHESVAVSDVVKVEFAAPEPRAGPRWIGRLRDEDVESAMDGRFETPPYEEPGD
jgi:hypothetical protein